MRVSCIIPTGNRRDVLPLAIASYLSQDWPDKELIVIDDGEISERDLLFDVGRLTYMRLNNRMTIGAKRNLACTLATGEVIAHFDSDDWSAPGRLRDQVERLQTSGKPMTGYHDIFFWSLLTNKAFRYFGLPSYSVGASMCYLKTWWRSHQFPDLDQAEDNHLVFAARENRELAACDGGSKMVCLIHGSNITESAKKAGTVASWPEVPREHLPEAFFAALDCVTQAVTPMP